MFYNSSNYILTLYSKCKNLKDFEMYTRGTSIFVRSKTNFEFTWNIKFFLGGKDIRYEYNYNSNFSRYCSNIIAVYVCICLHCCIRTE